MMRRWWRSRGGGVTWDAFALDGLGQDGGGLVAGLAQGLAQLLHAVAVYDDGMPAAHTHTHRDFICIISSDRCSCYLCLGLMLQ